MIRILLRQVGFIVVFLGLFALPLKGIDISQYNCSYWYETNPEAKATYSVYMSDSSYHVMLRLTTRSARQDSLYFYLQNNFTTEGHRIFVPQGDTLVANPALLIVSFEVKKSNENVLVIHYRNQQDYLFPIQLRYNGVQHPGIYQVEVSNGLPYFTSYLKADSSYFENPLDDSVLWVYQYSDQFNAAEPPMSTTYSVSPSLQRDTLVAFKGSFYPEPNKFYFIQKDTLDLGGITRYSGSEFYPKYRHLEDLVPPLIYITRGGERSKLERAVDLKAAFDEFWLTLYPIKRNAAEAIADYYRSVTLANIFFTDYKPGWKTDRGMLYIVLGPPQKVIREDWRELWIYDEELSFEFRIISNLFAYQQYYLIRRETYEVPWYNAVRRLRNNQ